MPIPLATAVIALKATKAVANALGTKPTPTPQVKVKKSKKYNPHSEKPKAGTPNTDVPVELDDNGYLK